MTYTCVAPPRRLQDKEKEREGRTIQKETYQYELIYKRCVASLLHFMEYTHVISDAAPSSRSSRCTSSVVADRAAGRCSWRGPCNAHPSRSHTHSSRWNALQYKAHNISITIALSNRSVTSFLCKDQLLFTQARISRQHFLQCNRQSKPSGNSYKTQLH